MNVACEIETKALKAWELPLLLLLLLQLLWGPLPPQGQPHK